MAHNGETLKVVKYRGSRIYVRFISGRQYEVLVSFKGQIFCHPLQLLKPRPHEDRLSVKERDAGALDELLRAGIQLTDNLHIERSLRKQLQNYIKRIYEQTTAKIFGLIGARTGLPGQGGEAERG